MVKMDEMERSIRTQSQALGFKLAILLLAVWTLVELVRHLMTGWVYAPVPALVLIIVLIAQRLYEESMKRRMVAGDEEYREPNRVMQMVVTAIGVAVVTLAAGFFVVYAG